MKDNSIEYKAVKCDSYRLGAHKVNGGYEFLYSSASDNIELLLYSEINSEPRYVIPLDSSYKNGNVFCVLISGVKLDRYYYIYRDSDHYVTDPYSVGLTGFGENNEPSDRMYAMITLDEFDWEDDSYPQLKDTELVMYKLHARGYTASRYSKCRNKGTFKGLTEKIPYLRELGINAAELMPCYEHIDGDGKISYWGYEKGFYFVPKASLTSIYGKRYDYTLEYKSMIKEFHRNGIEVYMELYFPSEIPSQMVDDCVRYWRREYHIDGAHVICNDSARCILADDTFIKNMKLFGENWGSSYASTNLYEYNDGFLYAARKMLKGDENQLQDFLNAFLKNPGYAGNVNYVATNNGFTLMDLVSYDRKHNEANGENNRDGIDYNYSWNCGIEGSTQRRKITELRFQNMRNAMTMVLLAQGIPLIYAGDEFGNSQDGNNNAYCQDNETGWTDWKRLTHNRTYFEFVQMLIAFRKKHCVLHMHSQSYMTDYKYYGLPDVSYHSKKAWYPDMEHYNRHIGVMLCGQYAEEEDNVYIAFNLHWEEHELALPTVPGRHWKVCFLTTDMEADSTDIIRDKMLLVSPRTIVVLIDEKNS